MSERAKCVFAWVILIAVCLIYFGGGYYFGVIDRPRRHPGPADSGDARADGATGAR